MIAAGFLAQGARVYISARKAAACDQTARELSSLGHCVSLPADVSTVEGARTLAAAYSAHEPQLDILVNNAGAAWGETLEDFPEGGWDKVMNINLKSPFFLTQKLLPLLAAAGTHENPSRVINIGSIDGLHVTSLPTYSYGASKAGLHHLTRILAVHLAERYINVNAIAPGPFESKMMEHTLKTSRDQIVRRVPRRRIGEPEDMAGAAMFLASRAASYITGVVLPVDGGITAAL
jgi:NAD(P)-dependent dehydrogenase (short-subunit alcohol dehydrogenase family)